MSLSSRSELHSSRRSSRKVSWVHQIPSPGMNDSETSSVLLAAKKQFSDMKMNSEESPDLVDQSEEQSNASCDSGGSEMEPFDTFKTKIYQLLDSIGYRDLTIEPIQHGYGFQNCVYALGSIQNPTERLNLRVAIDGFMG